MFENIMKLFKKVNKKNTIPSNSKEAAKERLHLVLMQDRANVSVDFLELMKQEIIDVIKKYIEIDENAIDVRLTNKENEDGTNGAPALYANIPIINLKNEVKTEQKETKKEELKRKNEIEAREEKEIEKIINNNKNNKEKEKTEDKKVEESNKEEKNKEKINKEKINKEKTNKEEKIKKNKTEEKINK